MAIVSADEIWEARSSSKSKDGVRKYSRAWRVITDDMDDDALAVQLADGIPRIRDVYSAGDSVDLGALVEDVSAKQSDGPFIWLVDVQYSTQQLEEGEEDENPLARPATLNWGNESDSAVMTVDKRGVDVLTSAGEPFDPGLSQPRTVITLTIEKNEDNYDPQEAVDYQDSINSDTWFGFAPGFVQLKSITASSQFEGEFAYYKKSYSFRMHKRGFQPRILDRGFTYLDDDGQIMPFEFEGHPPSTPQLLNGLGGPLAKTGDDVFPGVATPTKVHEDTLESPMNASTTAMNLVGSGGTLFGGLPCIVTVDDEQMQVITYLFGDYVVERGYNGTQAAAHAVGATVKTGPVFLYFQEFDELPFAPLNVP